jgi:hypothetical protein
MKYVVLYPFGMTQKTKEQFYNKPVEFKQIIYTKWNRNSDYIKGSREYNELYKKINKNVPKYLHSYKILHIFIYI